MKGAEGACYATGAFNLDPNREYLLMEVMCEDGHARTLRAPKLDKQENIFQIPFRMAVVSIIEEKDKLVLHLHYYENEKQQVVPLYVSGKFYRYSFANLVPTKVTPIPIQKS